MRLLRQLNIYQGDEFFKWFSVSQYVLDNLQMPIYLMTSAHQV